jgi:hypothetical protein
MKTFKLGAALALCLSVTPALASNLGYSLLGINLTGTRYKEDIVLDGIHFDRASGLALYGAYQFNDNFFLELSGAAQANSKEWIEFTTSVSYLAGGFALPIGGQTDLVLRLASVSVEAEVCNVYGWRICGSVEDTGIGASAGVRHMVTPKLELNAQYIHVDLNDFDDSDTAELGAAFWFNEHSSLRLNFSNNEDDRTTALGYRYTF